MQFDISVHNGKKSDKLLLSSDYDVQEINAFVQIQIFLYFNFAEPKNYSKKNSRSLKHDETCLVCRIDFNFGSFRAEWRNSRRPFDDALLLSPVSWCVQQMQNVLQLLRPSKLRTEQVLGLLQRPVQQMYKMLNTKDIMLILTCHKKIK